MTATAELVVPKSMPMTEPLTFSLDSSAYPLTNDEPKGERMAGARRTADVARGRKVRDILEESIVMGMWGYDAAGGRCTQQAMER
jgi:hypothetical protein